MTPNKVNPLSLIESVAAEQTAQNHKMMNTAITKQAASDDADEREIYLGACEFLTQLMQQITGNVESMQVNMD